MLKIEQNWGKIANYPIDAQQRFGPLFLDIRNYLHLGYYALG